MIRSRRTGLLILAAAIIAAALVPSLSIAACAILLTVIGAVAPLVVAQRAAGDSATDVRSVALRAALPLRAPPSLLA